MNSDSDLRRIDLQALVPHTADIVELDYEITPPAGRILLCRTPDDLVPAVLSGPSGSIEIQLSEPQTLYVRALEQTEDFRIAPRGFRLAAGESHLDA